MTAFIPVTDTFTTLSPGFGGQKTFARPVLMLLLESFDATQRSASFLALTGNTLRIREDFARLAEVASDLGFRGLLLQLANSKGGITQLEAYMGPERRGMRRACLGNSPPSPDKATVTLRRASSPDGSS